MEKDNVIYVAVNKETGKVMGGAKGQHAFGSAAGLSRSIGQAYSYTAHKEGVKPKDLYNVVAIDVTKVIESGLAMEVEKNGAK